MNQGKQKVFLAIGMKGMEEFLKKQLSNEYNFVGEAIYREGVVNNAIKCNPDIIILRETLNGSKNILDIVYELRLNLPDSRIIFLASDRKPGDALLAELVGNGVYDIMTGNRISAPDLIKLIQEPNKFSDVAMYRPKVKIDNNSKETIFEAPVKEVVKQVKQTVYVEGGMPILPPSYGENQPSDVENDKKSTSTKKRNRRRFLKGFGGRKKKHESHVEHEKEVEEISTPEIDFSHEIEEEQSKKLKERTPKLHQVEKNPVQTQSSRKNTSSNSVKQPELFTFDSTNEEEKQDEVSEELPLFIPPKEEESPKVNPEIVFDPNPQPEQKVEPELKPKPQPQPNHIQISSYVPQQPEMIAPSINEPMTLSSKQKILTFVGGDYGVGNSQVAHNTALALGKRGYKTIFIELREEGSTIEYLYQLALSDKGLDFALQNIESENFSGIEDSIIHIEEVRRQNTNSILENSYKYFSSNVDYLFFSPDYILETDPEKKAINPSLLKELCMHLFFQSGYQYIILDAEPNLFNPYTEVALGFGTHVFFTLTQDVCHIGRAVRNISEINKRINIVSKLYYIMNKFDEQASLSKKDIQDWLKAEIDSFIPMLHKDFIDANMNGVPVLLVSKDKRLKKSFDELVNHILKK